MDNLFHRSSKHVLPVLRIQWCHHCGFFCTRMFISMVHTLFTLYLLSHTPHTLRFDLARRFLIFWADSFRLAIFFPLSYCYEAFFIP
jgi:hypothetical protein